MFILLVYAEYNLKRTPVISHSDFAKGWYKAFGKKKLQRKKREKKEKKKRKENGYIKMDFKFEFKSTFYVNRNFACFCVYFTVICQGKLDASKTLMVK